MKVMMFVKASTATAEPPTAEALEAMHRFNEELERAGVLVTLGGLMPTGARLRFTREACTVVDGPFAETKEMIAGFSILEVASFEEALAWARRAPFGLTVPAGAESEVEIRPLFDPAMFDPPA